MGTRRGFSIAMVLCPILALWRLVAWKYHIYTTAAIYWGRTDIQLDGLLWGSLFAYAHRYYHSKFWTMLQKPALCNAVIGLFLVSSQWTPGGYKMQMVLYTAQAFLVPIMLIGTVGNPRSHLSTFLEWKPLKWMGRLSYGMYLWQQLFLSPVQDRSRVLGRLQVWPYNIVCVFLFTVASYYLLERRLIRVGHRLATPVSAGRPDAVAQSPIIESTV
jgi:peptidoglycan/LPS O-acetylase OafA/YrhL